MLAAEWIHEYLNLLHDPAHIVFELTLQAVIDGLLLGLGWPYIKRWVKRHEEQEHGQVHYYDPKA